MNQCWSGWPFLDHGHGGNQIKRFEGRARDQRQSYLTESVFEVVLQKSIPTQISQLILYISNSKG